MKLIAEVNDRRQEYLLKEGRTVIGRDLSCDITLLSQGVSRRHLECLLEGQRLSVRDLGSKNGTYVGDQRVSLAELRPGDVVTIGNARLRFEPGTSLGAPGDQKGVSSQMQTQLVVPKLPTYTEESDPTPVDAGFAPSHAPGEAAAAAPAAEGVGVPALRESAPPAEVEALEVQPGGQPLSRHEKRLFLIPLIAGAAVVVLGLFLFIGLRPRPAETLSHAQYNKELDRAVELFDRGERSASLKLLRALETRSVQDDPRTAPIMADAVEQHLKLAQPEQFAKEWPEAKKLWEELRSASGATESARTLAAAQITWIGRESHNMGSYNDFIASFDSGSWAEAMNTARKVPADSIFYPLVEKKSKDASAKFLATALSTAQEAEKRKDWDAALKIYDEMASIPGVAGDAIGPGRTRSLKYKAEAANVKEAAKLLAEGKAQQAAQLVADVDPKGPYGTEAAGIKAQLASAEVRGRAASLYDSGQADAALKLLKDAKLEQSELYQRVRTVSQNWARAEQAIKDGKFQDAKAACQTIVDLEKAPNNRYRIDASEFIASWRDKAKQLAGRLRNDGLKAIGDGNYKRARESFEEAVLTDPDGAIGRDDIEALKKEAGRQYNLAINLVQSDTVRAQKMLREVKDMLRPNEPYYDQASEWLDRLIKKP